MARPIDADALKGAINKATDVVKGKGYDELTHIFDGIIDLVDRMPTADVVERKVGKWIVIMDEPNITFDECKCSECGVVEYFNKGWKKFNYCPSCGAEMKGDDDGI